MGNKNENPDILLLEDICKSVSLHADTLTTVIGKTEDDGQKSLLSAMLDTCEGFVGTAKKRLQAFNTETKTPGILEKLPSELSVVMSTLTDRSPSKIAELVIENAVMGVSEFKEKIRNADEAGASIENIRLAGDILSFQEETINKMRRYL
jgi:hypothetical protein